MLAGNKLFSLNISFVRSLITFGLLFTYKNIQISSASEGSKENK